MGTISHDLARATALQFTDLRSFLAPLDIKHQWVIEMSAVKLCMIPRSSTPSIEAA